MEFDRLLWKLEREAMVKETEGRELADGIFTEWRDTYVNFLLKWVRLYHEAETLGLRFGTIEEWIWKEAALLILTMTSLDVQDCFLRSSLGEKDIMVAAVIKDGGIQTASGYFAEMPPS